MKRAARWAFLVLLTGAAGCQAPAADEAAPADTLSAAATAYVLYPDDGEVLVPCRAGSSGEGRWIIKADPVNTGSSQVAMGTQVLPGGERIPVHRHEDQDEILFLHEGHALGIVGDSTVRIEPGTTIYVPRGVWHGVDNTGAETARVVWVVVPPGLERFFREIGVPPGAECVPLPEEDMMEIRRRHGITQRIE